MKAFKFTLQTLLNVRQTQEDALKAKLGEERARLAALQKAEEDARNALLAEQGRLMERYATGAVNAADYMVYDHYCEYMRGVIADCERAVREQEDVVAGVQRELVKALQDKKVLEKLKDKQYKEYLTEVKKEDDKMIDDFVSYSIISS